MEIANEVNNLIQSENTGATDNFSSEIQSDEAAMDYVLGKLDSEGTTSEVTKSEQVNTNAETEEVTTDEQSEQTDSEVETETEEATNEVSIFELPDDSTVIIVNGQEMSIGELKNGYSRTADYTRKTQEAAAIRKEADKLILQAQQAVSKDVLEGIKRQFEVEYRFNRPTDAEWADMMKNDPVEFTNKAEFWQARDAQVAQIQEMDARMRANIEAAEKEAHDAAVDQAQVEFTGKFPEFLDTTKRGPLLKDMVNILENMGYSHDDISNISDARHLELVYLASKAIKAEKSSALAKQVLASKPITKTHTPTKTSKPKPTLNSLNDDVKREQDLISFVAANHTN